MASLIRAFFWILAHCALVVLCMQFENKAKQGFLHLNLKLSHYFGFLCTKGENIYK